MFFSPQKSQIFLKPLSTSDEILFRTENDLQQLNNSVSSHESLDILLPRCQTVDPKKLSLLDIEKSIVNYLKKIGIQTKTDPAEKSLTYYSNKRFKIISTKESNDIFRLSNDVDLIQQEFRLPPMKLMSSQESYENGMSPENKKSSNQFHVSQINLMSCKNDSSFEVEASNDNTPITFRNQREKNQTEFNLSKNPFCRRRFVEKSNLSKFSQYLEDHSLNNVQIVNANCNSMRDVKIPFQITQLNLETNAQVE